MNGFSNSSNGTRFEQRAKAIRAADLVDVLCCVTNVWLIVLLVVVFDIRRHQVQDFIVGHDFGIIVRRWAVMKPQFAARGAETLDVCGTILHRRRGLAAKPCLATDALRDRMDSSAGRQCRSERTSDDTSQNEHRIKQNAALEREFTSCDSNVD